MNWYIPFLFVIIVVAGVAVATFSQDALSPPINENVLIPDKEEIPLPDKQENNGQEKDPKAPQNGEEKIVEEKKLDASGATTEGIASLVNANNQFSLELYARLKEDKGENIFFSPYSISTDLTMTYEGAKGDTAKEIQSVFHFTEDAAARKSSMAAVYNQLNEKNAGYKLNTANALWVQKNYPFSAEYLETVEKYYGGKASNLDFAGATEEARQTINQWVEEKTSGKIKDLLPPGILTGLTQLVLTNAIYFKGTWVKQFNPDETKNEDFKISQNSPVQVPMMKRTDKEAVFPYMETGELQVLEMPYEGDALSMLLLLPKNEDLESLESTLTLENLNQWKAQLKEGRVDVFIPKFTFTKEYPLNNTLQELGMNLPFSGDADFSGMDGTKNLSISAVVHKAFIEVNEEGTEAAAATGVVFGTTSVQTIPVFHANHPFIFLIQERKTGNILFIGRVSNPLVE